MTARVKPLVKLFAVFGVREGWSDYADQALGSTVRTDRNRRGPGSFGNRLRALATAGPSADHSDDGKIPRRTRLRAIGGRHREWRGHVHSVENLGQTDCGHLDSWMGNKLLLSDLRDDRPSAGGARLHDDQWEHTDA